MSQSTLSPAALLASTKRLFTGAQPGFFESAGQTTLTWWVPTLTVLIRAVLLIPPM